MSELENLKEQLRQLNGMIAQETEEHNKMELEQAKRDMEELIELMEEEEAETSQIDEAGTEESADYLPGSRCMAPYDSDRCLSLHRAIIMETESANRVRVLFSHPTCPAMKPCSHFLSSNCQFNENCRFSHGYSVELERIERYQEPDFSLIALQGLVLVKGESEIWEMGRINAIDKQNVAVKVLRTGVEVSSERKDLLPLEDVEEKQSKDESWSELKQETLGKITVGDLGQWNGSSVGMKLMMKMGYKIGDGLGKRNDGIVHTIQSRICKKNATLDEVMLQKHKYVDGERRQTRTNAKKLANVRESEKCIFAFINKKLEKQSDRSLTHKRQDPREVAGYSTRTLGVKNIDLELKLKQMVAERKKLEDGLKRNRNDKNTVSRMTESLRRIDEQMTGVKRKLSVIHTEVNSRNSKRKTDF